MSNNKLFQFTNKKPSSEKIWEEVNKLVLSNTEGYSELLIKILIWIGLSASKDFKKSKEAINDVLENKTSIEIFRTNFITAFNNKYDIEINPTTIILPEKPELCVVYNKNLLIPILGFKHIFSKIETDKLITIANTIWDLTENEIYELKIDNEVLLQKDTKLTTYTIQIINEDLLFKNNFRVYFKSEYKENDKPLIVENDITDFKILLKNKLKKEIIKGNQQVILPKIIIKDNNE